MTLSLPRSMLFTMRHQKVSICALEDLTLKTTWQLITYFEKSSPILSSGLHLISDNTYSRPCSLSDPVPPFPFVTTFQPIQSPDLHVLLHFGPSHPVILVQSRCHPVHTKAQWRQ